MPARQHLGGGHHLAADRAVVVERTQLLGGRGGESRVEVARRLLVVEERNDALADVVEDNGGSIHLRRKVTEILTEGSGDSTKVTGVRLAARKGVEHEVKAKMVVSGADLEATVLNLIPKEKLPTKWVKKTESFVNADGLFMTSVGLDVPPNKLMDMGFERTNYWCFDSYDFEEVYAKARSGTSGDFGAYITR